MRTEVNPSHLEGKIKRGYPSMNQMNEYLFIASLQINYIHVCCAGMFQLGFLITEVECAIEIREEQKAAYAVMGHFELKKGERLQIQDLNIYKRYIGILKVGKISMFNPLMIKLTSKNIKIYASIDKDASISIQPVHLGQEFIF